jgi:alanyl-tRNA synthetase
MTCRLNVSGGTHMFHAAEAQAFVLVEETAVAKGIRRVSAVAKNATTHQGNKKYETMSLKL